VLLFFRGSIFVFFSFFEFVALKFTENSRKNRAKSRFGRSIHLTLFPALVYDIVIYAISHGTAPPLRGRFPPQ
jgi:hypothetical protein